MKIFFTVFLNHYIGSINPVNTALDPTVLNVGVRITHQKYLPISSEWIQTTYTWTEVNFWLYYGTGEIGEIAGVALQVKFNILFNLRSTFFIYVEDFYAQFQKY